jgi:hypothetical protein
VDFCLCNALKKAGHGIIEAASKMLMLLTECRADLGRFGMAHSQNDQIPNP